MPNPRPVTNCITHSELLKRLRYDPATGLFHWLKPGRGIPKSAKFAGSISPRGYAHVRIDGVIYQANRLAWFYMKGEWPKEEIDHENRINSDNRWENLREATRLEQAENLSFRRNNTSGYTGVARAACGKPWFAQIRKNGKVHYLGKFDDPEAAARAYAAAKAKLHTFHPFVAVP